MKYLIAALAALLSPAAAQAEWYESSSAHFVVYADDSERDLRRFSEQLERFHQAMAVVTGTPTDPPSPSNRVTVFVVKSEREVRRLLGDGSRYTAGFYIPRAGGSVAYVPRVNAATSGGVDQSMLILLHEYAHHFLFSANPFPMPLWMVEGGAEFFASAEFGADGSVKIGMPARHRGGELFFARDVSAAQLVDPELYTFDRTKGYDAFYGKSWLLYHYLIFEPERKGQLRTYLAGLLQGKSPREAAEEAFGDLRTLEMNLERYMRERTMMSLVLSPEKLEQPTVALRPLTEGEVAILPVRLRSRRGVDRERAFALLGQAREIAGRFPGDAAVLSALAEAEYDAGNDAEAIAAADAALAIDAGQVNAYVQKGYALFRRAGEAEPERQEAAYREAMRPFSALNRRENDHPLPLIHYFRSFAERGAEPPEIAVQGLERAAELAPFDLSLRLNLARRQAFEGRLADARHNLTPVAYHPHGGGISEYARAILQRLESGPIAPEEVDKLFAAEPQGETEGEDEGSA